MFDPRDVFDFRQVHEGPVEPEVIPGFGGVPHITRVIDDDPEVWVELAVAVDGRELVWAFSPCFDDAEEAVQWLTSK